MRNILKQLNFSDKEIDIYLAALAMDSAPISDLAKKAGIKRPTAYVILEKLKEKGLVALSKKKGKQIFISESPEKLLKIVEQQKEDLSEKEREIKKSLPKFEALTKTETTIPLVRYYEGKEGIWNIVEDLMKTKSEVWLIAPGKIWDIFGIKRMIKNVTQKRRQIGQKAYVITDQHPQMVKLWKMGEEEIQEYRFVPQTIELDAAVYVYNGKIAILFYKEPFNGVIIENKTLFQIFKFMFDSLWKELEGKNLPSADLLEESEKIQWR